MGQGSFQHLYRRFRAWLEANALQISARWAYMRGSASGELESAEARFGRLAGLRPRSFSAHLYLARIADRRRDRGAALQALRDCYRISPTRLRRARLPEDLRDRVLWSEGISERLGLGWEGAEAESWVPAHSEQRRASRSAAAALEAGQDAELARSDFSSYAEFQRFSDLPPISPDEIQGTDWDEVAERLFEEEL